MTLSRSALRTASTATIVTAFTLLAAWSPPALHARSGAIADDASRLIEFGWVRAHLDSVLRELPQRDLSGLSASQRKRRTALLATLKAYRDRGQFPRNYDFPGQAVPYFTDRKTGVLCAVGYLLESTGRRDIVDRVTRANNNVRVRELAGDTALTAWLDASGLTLEEAARIQVVYERPSAFSFSPAQVRRLTILGLTPFALAGSVISGTWNTLGNSDGHKIGPAVSGFVSGAASIGLGVALSGTPGIPKSSGMIMAGVGTATIVLAARSLVHRHEIVEAIREEQKSVKILSTSVTPMIAMGKGAAPGVMVSVQF